MNDGADVIKVIVDGVTATLSLEEVKMIVEEAHRAGRKVAAHATSNQAVLIAVDAGVDSVEHAYNVSDDALQRMAKKGIFLVPTDKQVNFYLDPANLGPEERKQAEARMTPFVQGNQDRLARALKAGVPVAAGSDVYYRHLPLTRGAASLQMFRAYAASGMSPIEVLRTATLNAAKLLGADRSLGLVEQGFSADIIATCGNPLTDITALDGVRFVMKAGAIARNDTARCAAGDPRGN